MFKLIKEHVTERQQCGSLMYVNTLCPNEEDIQAVTHTHTHTWIYLNLILVFYKDKWRSFKLILTVYSIGTNVSVQVFLTVKTVSSQKTATRRWNKDVDRSLYSSREKASKNPTLSPITERLSFISPSPGAQQAPSMSCTGKLFTQQLTLFL